MEIGDIYKDNNEKLYFISKQKSNEFIAWQLSNSYIRDFRDSKDKFFDQKFEKLGNINTLQVNFEMIFDENEEDPME